MHSILRSFMLAAGFACYVAAAHAQGMGMTFFGASGLPLTTGDFSRMAKAADPLLNDETIPIGTVQWRVFNSKKKLAPHLSPRTQALPKAA